MNEDNQYPLEVWYEKYRSKCLEELTINDLCTACRQRVDIERIHNVVAEALIREPFLGEMFEGELAYSFSKAFDGPWPWDKLQGMRLRQALAASLQLFEEGIASEVERLMSRLD